MNALSRFHAFTSAHTHSQYYSSYSNRQSAYLLWIAIADWFMCVRVFVVRAYDTLHKTSFSTWQHVFINNIKLLHEDAPSDVLLPIWCSMLCFFFSFDRMHILHPSWLSIRCLFDNRFSMRIKFFFPLLSPVIRSQNVLNKIAANFICFANVL